MTARRRFGNIRRTSSGRYQARYPGADGRPQKGPRTFATKGEANRFLVEIETDLHRGTWIDPAARAVRFAEFADEWLAHRKLAPRTRDLYADLLRMHIVPDLGLLALGTITPIVVRRWHTATANRTGATRTRQAYSLLRAILNTAVSDGLLGTNPCQIRGAGQVRSPERPLLTMEQVYALADAIEPDLHAVVLVTFWAHLRLGEVLGLRWEDVDLARGTLRVERQVVRTKAGVIETEPKAASRRTVHLPAQALSILTDLHGTGDLAGRVFDGPRGRELQANYVQKAWERARASVQMPDAHFHDLRHAGLTLVAQSGATTKEIMARGGHSTPRAALIYQHAADERDKELAARLSALPVTAEHRAS